MNKRVDAEVVTPAFIRRIHNNNYASGLGRVYPGFKTKRVGDLNVLSAARDRNIIFLPGFQANSILPVFLIDALLSELGPEYGYYIVEWPGVGLNDNVDQGIDIPTILVDTVMSLLASQSVEMIVPLSMACRAVYCYHTEFLNHSPALRIAHVVPAILPGANDRGLKLYFNFFKALGRIGKLDSYQLFHNTRMIQWLWNRVVAPGSKHQVTYSMLNMCKRTSSGYWVATQFSSMANLFPPSETSLNSERICYVFAEHDRLTQPEKQIEWLKTQGVGSRQMLWINGNHLLESEAPHAVANKIVEYFGPLHS